MNGRDPLDVIKKYGHAAKHGGVSCDLARCPRCQGRPVRFKCHGVRNRLFLVFAKQVIRRVWSYLTRWKCPLCQRTFTVYPDFALPFKRYVLLFILERCAAYVEDTVRTYREGVTEEGEQISHEDADKGVKLWPSTLWRWVDRLGRFPVTVRQALNLIKQKNPSTAIFRTLGCLRIREGKFRSQARQHVLERCRALVTVNGAYARLFSASVFPELATRCGFG
jgi:hypothetical protein